MRLISFNIWGGKKYDNLIEFITEYSDSTDVFCFQEVFKTDEKDIYLEYPRADLYGSLHSFSPNSFAYFSEVITEKNLSSFFPDAFNFYSQVMDEANIHYPELRSGFGLACFVKKGIDVISFDDPFIVGERGKPFLFDTGEESVSRCIQNLTLKKDGNLFSVLNYHGLWNGGGKFDSGDRILQSQKIRTIMDSISHPKILCGDLNLRKDTESLGILKGGMVDLIEEYKIETTRSKLYGKPEKFADYTFVSPEIIVQNFQVPYSEASDHLPMILDFEI